MKSSRYPSARWGQVQVQRIDEVRPKLITLEQADALQQADRVIALMRQNIDERGFGPARVPSEDFVAASQHFQASLASAATDLPRLNALVAAAYLSPKLDSNSIDKTRATIKTLNDAQEQRAAEIGNSFTLIAELQAKAQALQVNIDAERERSRRDLEKLKDRDADLANIKIVTTVAAVAVSFVGTPAAGAALAAGVTAAGGVVYASNSGTPLNTETLVSIAQRSSEVYNDAEAARKAWDKHVSDLKTARDVFDGKGVTPKGAKAPLTKTDAVKLAGDSGKAFYEKVKTMSDKLGDLPKPESIQLNDVEAHNGELTRLLTDLGDVQTSTSNATFKLTQLQMAMAADEAAVSDARTVEQVLLELKPVNDQEILRWKTAALGLWTRQVQGLYVQAMDLRRSLFFETWKNPVLQEDVQGYPEEFTAYLSAGRYSPEAPNATSPAQLTIEHLNAESSKHLAVLSAIANSVSSSWEQYKAERASGAQPFFDQFDFSDAATAPVMSRLFLAQINAQIKRQIEFPQTRDVPEQFRILIPFSMTTPPVGLPERLLETGVANVTYKTPSALNGGKTLSFDITYRLAGELRREGICSYVDLSVPGGSTTATVRLPARDISSARSAAQQPLTFEKLRESRTAPPARTLYFMSISVSGSPDDGNWKMVPELTGFTFWRRIVQ